MLSKHQLEEMAEQYRGKKIIMLMAGPSVFRNVTSKKEINIMDFSLKYLKARIDLSDRTDPIWTINGHWGHQKGCTLGFSMHDFTMGGKRFDVNPNPTWIKALHYNSEVPLFTVKEIPEYPAMVRYPFEEIIKFFAVRHKKGNYLRNYFAETLNYMTALAIYFGVSEIEYFGSDYSPHQRAPWERASNEYWLGQAEARGIRIYLSSEFSNLLKTGEAVPERWPEYIREGYYGCHKDNFDVDLNAILEEVNQEEKEKQNGYSAIDGSIGRYDGGCRAFA